jgi:probable rRNA maturation factor
MKVSLDIGVSSGVSARLWRGLPRARSIARETIAAAAAEGGVPGEDIELSLCLADDAALRALNARWRGIDRPTNVLSFPAAVDAVRSPSKDGRPSGRPLDRFSRAPRARLKHHLGDIALAYETLAREAEELGVPLADHCRHLIAHGFLHLIGYDHQTDREAERMEALETRILARFGAADPYARVKVGG